MIENDLYDTTMPVKSCPVVWSYEEDARRKEEPVDGKCTLSVLFSRSSLVLSLCVLVHIMITLQTDVDVRVQTIDAHNNLTADAN